MPVYELGVDEQGQIFFTMKLVKGQDLSTIIDLVHQRREGWNLPRALGVLLRACEALSFAHSKGVLHRDIKPGNIMVGRFGETYVMDWGLAKVSDGQVAKEASVPAAPSLATVIHSPRAPESSQDSLSPWMTLDGTVIGTPAYMSPEQAQGELESIGPQSDVYSMGAILYQLLAGKPPYSMPRKRLSPEVVVGMLLAAPPTALAETAPNAPGELVAICEKAMARDPGSRYADMGEMAADISAYMEQRVVGAYEKGAFAELRKWVTRNKPIAASFAVAILALAGAFIVSVYSRDEALRRQAESERLLGDVLRLSAMQELDDIVSEADLLWPAVPDRVPDYETWLDRAQAFVAKLPEHRQKRDEIRARALPRSDEQLAQDRREHPLARELDEATKTLDLLVAGLESGGSASLETLEDQIVASERRVAALADDVARRWRWDFESGEDRWWHAQLSSLIEGIEVLVHEDTGLMFGVSPDHGWGVARRLEFARSIEEVTVSGAEARALWEAATAAISDRSQCPAYDGLVITPQLGLLPIGTDPDSGLWEFAHVATGAVPQRSEEGRLELTEESALVLVLIPGGSFTMGAQADDPAKPNYDPDAMEIELPRAVRVEPFFLSKYEMAQGQWLRFAGYNPSLYQEGGRMPEQHERPMLLPVERVSWSEARRMLHRVGLELPSEAEWEYAARAGTSTSWWTGTDVASLQGAANLADAYAQRKTVYEWPFEPTLDDGAALTAEVDLYRPSPLGLHSIHGNVWEWCDGDVGAMFDEGPRSDGAKDRVARGGSYRSSSRSARVSKRSNYSADYQHQSMGIRPARSISP